MVGPMAVVPVQELLEEEERDESGHQRQVVPETMIHSNVDMLTAPDRSLLLPALRNPESGDS